MPMYFTVDRNDQNFVSPQNPNDVFLAFSGPGSTPLSAAVWNALFSKRLIRAA